MVNNNDFKNLYELAKDQFGDNIMLEETLKKLHSLYQLAGQKAENILDIPKNLLNLLLDTSFSKEDPQYLDHFIVALNTCVNERSKTFNKTKWIVRLASEVITYILLCLIDTTPEMKTAEFDINGRRKALESELSKLLEKSCSENLPIIRDRFGIRTILTNKNLPSKTATKIICLVSDTIQELFEQKDSKRRTEFLEWLRKSNADEITLHIVEYMFAMNMKVIFKKDYITVPKQNNYQSIQYTLLFVDSGEMVELQFRTYEMHETAENGSASHDDIYKASKEIFKWVFHFDAITLTKLNINGFSSYTSRETDVDGIFHSKTFINRKISKGLVYDY